MNLHIFVFILFLLFACCRLFYVKFISNLYAFMQITFNKNINSHPSDRPTVRPSDQQRIFSSGHKEVRVKEHHHRLKLQQQQKASIYCLRVIKISTVSFRFFFLHLLVAFVLLLLWLSSLDRCWISELISGSYHGLVLTGSNVRQKTIMLHYEGTSPMEPQHQN